MNNELYVGTNYHPHDSNPETWTRDIRLMRNAGFRVVRLGHLAWDSYEPTDGEFDFRGLDQVMDELHASSIRVVLDVAVRPAPIWLHRKHPSISITNLQGTLEYPNHRYMEDVGDPTYQEYALRYTDALTKRYGAHPALLAFGIDNEPGDGLISYSETVRARFIRWLMRKYPTVAHLNAAWATQRWSRRLGSFEDVGFPASASVSGAPERQLDFRRFISDEIVEFLDKVIARVAVNAPGALTTSNMWYYSDKKYFDYSGIAYRKGLTRGGGGFYPGTSLTRNEGLMSALFGIARIQFENESPFWCTEFTTATAVPGSIRKSAYASLMLGNQMACAWTWQSMHGGEEQFLQGMVDWDGVPNRKYDEYRKIAEEFRLLERYGFPRRSSPEVALAFSFASQIASASYPERHDQQIETAFKAFTKRNVDIRVVDVNRSTLRYKLLIAAGDCIVDESGAAQMREFVRRGGTLVMTAYSAQLSAHGQVHSGTLPGLLDDVFGIRVSGFEETHDLNELSQLDVSADSVRLDYRGRVIECTSPRFELIWPSLAQVLGCATGLDRDYPLVTSHRYGSGKAIYIGLPAREELLEVVFDELIAELCIPTGPIAPPGVMARYIDGNHALYLNLDSEPKYISVPGRSRSILRQRDYLDGFTLEPHEPDFVEC